VFPYKGIELVSDEFKRLIPRGFVEAPSLFYERCFYSLRAMDKIIAVTPLYAEIPLVHRCGGVRGNFDYLTAPYIKKEIASCSAI